jgi:hypothetical protein
MSRAFTREDDSDGAIADRNTSVAPLSPASRSISPSRSPADATRVYALAAVDLALRAREKKCAADLFGGADAPKR